MVDIRFYINDVITHVNVGRLYPREFSFGDPLSGIGEAQLVVTIPPNLSTNSLLHRIIPNKFEVEITDGDPLRGGSILWAGYITTRVPDPEKMTITFDAVHWQGWYYRRIIPPKTWSNNLLSGDQYTIAYTLIDWAGSHAAAFKVARGTNVSGRTRQLTVNPWWSVGEAMDNLGKRDGGFEWSLGFRRASSDGKIQGFLELWETGATRSMSQLLYIDNTRSMNNARVGVMTEDGTIQATRVYATSDGEDPVYSSDVDALLASGQVLLLERATTYQDNRNRSTLFDYARAERLERNNPYTTVAVTIPESTVGNLALKDYRVGDRARLRVRDGWHDIDKTGVRIVHRSVTKSEGKPILTTLELDLTDVRAVA